MIVDAHQHLWELDRFSYSWCLSNPLLNRSFTLADYREHSRGLGIDQTVHVEADVDLPFILDESRHILQLASEPDNGIGGVVAAVRPESDAFEDHIQALAG